MPSPPEKSLDTGQGFPAGLSRPSSPACCTVQQVFAVLHERVTERDHVADTGSPFPPSSPFGGAVEISSHKEEDELAAIPGAALFSSGPRTIPSRR